MVGKAHAGLTVAANDPPETPDWADDVITTGTETPRIQNQQDIRSPQARSLERRRESIASGAGKAGKRVAASALPAASKANPRIDPHLAGNLLFIAHWNEDAQQLFFHNTPVN